MGAVWVDADPGGPAAAQDPFNEVETASGASRGPYGALLAAVGRTDLAGLADNVAALARLRTGSSSAPRTRRSVSTRCRG